MSKVTERYNELRQFRDCYDMGVPPEAAATLVLAEKTAESRTASPDTRFAAMLSDLRKYLDVNFIITSSNIGCIRRKLLMPFDCEWNGIVRKETAARENK